MAMLRCVFRPLALLLPLLAAWPAAAQQQPAEPAPGVPPSWGSAASLATPLGDALFRWRCTTGLREAMPAHADWPLRRVAGLCLCIAEHMRQDGLQDMPPFRGPDMVAALEAVEASLCRRPRPPADPARQPGS